MHFKHFCLLSVPFSSLVSANPQHVDVAIIGGGLAGLAAAKDLAAAKKSFVILEARDRVGGRVLNANLPGGGVEELGAEFVAPTQDRVLALARQLGLQTYSTYTAGNNTLYHNGSKTVYDADPSLGGLPPVDLESLSELQGFIQNINDMAKTIDVNAPWKHENATLWDSMTVKDFAKQMITLPNAQFLLENAVTSVLSTELDAPSLLYFVTYVASGGNETVTGTLNRLVGTHDGAQDSRINGGTQLLAIKLADRLGLEKIHLNSPVRKVQRKGNNYLVTSDRLSVTASHVVVAMSPPMAKTITFEPALSAGRNKLNSLMPMGSIGKAIALYPKPWWRDAGLNGQALSDTGSVRATFDNSPANGAYGAIMGFIEADEMKKLDTLSEEDAKDSVIQDLVKYFGKQAAKPTGFLLQRWDLEQFSKGGPVAYAPPGVLSSYGPYLRASSGQVHFCGTETATYWTGYMDGAIRSGERVAKEIVSSYGY